MPPLTVNLDDIAYLKQQPGLADGDRRAIDQDIIELQKGLHQQVTKKREYFMKLIRAAGQSREMDQRSLEQVAMENLIKLAYKKKLFQRAVKKLKSLLHYWLLHSSVSTSSRERCCGLFINQMGFRSINNSDRMVKHDRRRESYGSDDDIDERAEIFIANFLRQLSLERRVSLEPQYYIRDSFD